MRLMEGSAHRPSFAPSLRLSPKGSRRGASRFAAAGIAAALLCAAPARAGDASFEARADKTSISMNETLTLRLVISGKNLNVAQPKLPSIQGFRAYSSGQSQNYSFVNGSVTSQSVYSYALAPQSPGEYTIPSFSIEVGGQTLTSEPIHVSVVSGAAAPAGEAAAAPAAGDGAKSLFVTTSVDKKTAYVGEAITLAFRFYSRARLTSQPAYTPAEATGFVVEDLPPQRQGAKTVDGQLYQVVELLSALFPAAPGRHTLGPASLECRVQDFNVDPFESFFQDFFSGGRAVTLRSDPLEVTVLPLPAEGRPEGFRGDVGRYRIEAAVDLTSPERHEPVTLTVTVSGEGNVRALSAPALPRLDGFKTYETLGSVNVSKEDFKVSGSKVFKTVLKPDVSGPLEIPPVRFSFFDPAARAYRTVETKPLRLHVKASASGPAPDASAPSPVPALEGVKVVSEDIRFLKTGSAPQRRRRPWHDGRAALWINLLPVAAFLAAAGARAWRERLSRDPAGAAARRAWPEARAELARAKKRLARGDEAAYRGALPRALAGYLGAKLGVPSQGLSWEEADAALARRGLPEGPRAEARRAWEALDRMRFSTETADAAAVRRLGEDVERAIRSLEAAWRR
jgi:hypothetical protein